MSLIPRYIANKRLEQLKQTFDHTFKQKVSQLSSPLLVKTLINKNLPQKKIYINDYFNTFSDFREIKYKLMNTDFHSVKHKNKEIDTFEFFELFFTKYIKSIDIDIKSDFIFILKKITNYEHILIKVLEKYKYINIKFIIIESKYTELLLDKNKDDFLCQYLFCFLMEHNDNCILISNDKYRDLPDYMTKYTNINIKILQNGIIPIQNFINMQSNILGKMNNITYKRSVIPKNKLHKII